MILTWADVEKTDKNKISSTESTQNVKAWNTCIMNSYYGKTNNPIITQDSRKSIYRAFIAASFNYCPISWIFCGKKNTTKLEKLQERALRLVFCDKTATYDDLLKRGNFLLLKAFRTRCLAVEVYKCVRGLNPTYLTILETNGVSISLNFILIRMDLDPSSTLVQNFGILCHVR